MIALPQEPFGFFKVVGLGSRVWVQSFKRIFLLSILCAIIAVVPSHVVATLQPGLNVTMRFVAGGILILFGIVALAVEAAIYAQLNATGLLGESLTFGSALKTGLRNIWRILVATVLFFLLLAFAFVAAVVPFYLARAYWPVYANAFDVAALAVAVVFCFYITVNFIIYLPLIVIEKLGPLASLKRSFHLVGRDWWRTAFVAIFAVIVMVLLQQLVMVVSKTPMMAALAGIVAFVLYFPFNASMFLVQMRQLELREKHFKK